MKTVSLTPVFNHIDRAYAIIVRKLVKQEKLEIGEPESSFLHSLRLLVNELDDCMLNFDHLRETK